jgi:hypothetical protein
MCVLSWQLHPLVIVYGVNGLLLDRGGCGVGVHTDSRMRSAHMCTSTIISQYACKLGLYRG